jgi:hypothetical protein
MPNGRDERDIVGVVIYHFMDIANSVYRSDTVRVLKHLPPDIQHRY